MICKNCKTEFPTSKNGKQLFCSPKCKVAFGRKVGKEVGAKPASEIEPKPGETLPNLWREDLVYMQALKNFCKINKTTPDEILEWLDKNYRAKDDKAKKETAKLTSDVHGGGLTTHQLAIRKHKLGY